MRLPAEIVPDAVDEALAEAVRERLERVGYTRYARLDRGSYEVASVSDEPRLFEVLARIAGAITGRALAVVEARAIRLAPGDYVLTRHDRVFDDRPVEVVLELSRSRVPDAEVHYRHRGQVFFTFAPAPGALAVVERGPTVMCNHTYVSKRWTGPPVVRLVALLREAR